jgi:hypothetical protein
MGDLERGVIAVQSGYFVLTGAWPLVHDESFQVVTGPKVDMWLAKVVGAVVATIGVALGVAAARGRHREPENVCLALGSDGAIGVVGALAAAVAAGLARPVAPKGA